MNFNLISYTIYFPAMVAIAVVVAQVCHEHGRVWMLRIFDNETEFVDAVNNVLLVGCYTVNIGYVAMVVGAWEPISSLPEMLDILSHHIAIILLSLAGLHYTNITVLFVWAHLKKPKQNNADHERHNHLPEVIMSTSTKIN